MTGYANVNALTRGSTIDHYHLIRQLGRGGMGTVYLARDAVLGRVVALKVLNARIDESEKELARFYQEARATARLSHQNIVNLYSVGSHVGAPYFVLEYVRGENLSERLRREEIPLWDAVRIASGIATGVAAAHEVGVVHLDLKPSNVIISTDGRVRVLDFGVARILSRSPSEFTGESLIVELPGGSAVDSTTPANETSLVGTPNYMAPEQFIGFSSKATDVWALGVIVHELCIGARPYSSSDIHDLMFVVTSRDPVPVAPAFRDLPSALSELILQCLAKDPAERPSANDVAERLAALDLRPSSATDERSPFRALQPFSEKDADVFFGRDSEIAACLERLRSFALVPIVGPSGAGKSSLVRAGVIPKLRQSANWSIVRLRPGPHPVRALASRLLQEQSTSRTTTGRKKRVAHEEVTVRELPYGLFSEDRPEDRAALAMEVDDPDQLASHLLGSPEILAALLRKRADEDGCRVLVVVDQLEEVVTMCDSPEERAVFITALCTASSDPEEPVRVLVTIRDDYPGRLPWGSYAQSVFSGMLMIAPPSDESLRQTVIRPLRSRGYSFDDPSLLDAILDAVRGEEMRLPLLQFCLTQLWQDRDEVHRKLLRSTYERMGEVGGALAAHAEHAVEALSHAELGVARSILLRLLNPQGMRLMVTRSQLIAGLGTNADKILDLLVQARLLAVRRGEVQGEQEPVLELAHDSLPQLWKRLAGWFSESKDEIRAVSSVVQAAESWDRLGRLPDGLWSGDALIEARLALSRATAPVAPVALDFLTASERREIRQRRRRRIVVGSIMIAIAAAAVFASVAAWALQGKAEAETVGRLQAEQERARSLEESALASLANGDMPKARAQIRTLLETGDSSNARLAWQRISKSPLLWRKHLGYYTYDVAFDPVSGRIAGASRSGHIYLLDPHDVTASTLRGHRDQVLALAYAPDGAWLVSSAIDGEVRVWDGRSGLSSACQVGHGPATSIEVSPHGSHAAIGWDHGGVTIIALPDCRKSAALGSGQTGGHALAWTSDGTKLAVGDSNGSIRTYLQTNGEQVSETSVKGSVSAMARSPDGALLAVGTEDGAVMLCETGGTGCRHLEPGHEGRVGTLRFSPDGRLVASGSKDGKIKIWDIASGEERAIMVSMLGGVLSVDFDHTGRRLVAAGLRGVELWRVPKHTAQPRWRTQGLFGPVWTAVFSADDRWVLAGGEGRFAILDRATAKPRAVVDIGTAEIRAVVALSDGKRALLVRNDGRIELRSIPHARLMDSKADPSALPAVSAAVFRDPDGIQKALIGMTNGAMVVWELEPLRPVHTIQAHSRSVRALATSPDGRRVVSGGSDGTLRVWDTKNWGSSVLQTRSDAIWGASFRPDGQEIAFATDAGYVEIVNMLGKARRVWQHRGRLWRVAFHPDGERVALASANGNAYLVDVASGKSKIIEKHGDEVNDVRFDSSGRFVLTASDDGTVRTHDTDSVNPLWFGTGFVGKPPFAVTHNGWIRGNGQTASSGKETWATSLHRARSVSRLESMFCVLGMDGKLEWWRVNAASPSISKHVKSGEKVQVVADGCVVVGNESSTWHTAQGTRTLPKGITAVAWSEQRGLLTANEKSLQWTEPKRSAPNEVAISGGVTALLDTGDAVVLGHDDGAVQVRAWSGLGRVASQLDATPPAAVTLLRAAASGTVIAGFQDGTVGLWDPKNGRRLDHRYVFGRAIDVIATDSSVVAVSDLGDQVVLDLSVLQVPYCMLMRQVWNEAPLVWRDSVLQVRDGRDHSCWNHAALPASSGRPDPRH